MTLELSPAELATLENALMTSITHTSSDDEIRGFRDLLAKFAREQYLNTKKV